jgi:hypothetical protein
VGVGFAIFESTTKRYGARTVAVLFVLDGAVSFVSSIRDYTFTSALGSISARFEPDEAAALDLGPAIAVALAWVVVLMIPGVLRFLRSDFK